MKQSILFASEARRALRDGINLADRVVGSTYGPSGKNVISHVIMGGVRSTKDGVSALNEISPDDPFINAGVKLVRQAAQKTADEAGDSTTTTTILTCALVNAIESDLAAAVSPYLIRKSLEEGVKEVSAWIKENATPLEDDPEKVKFIATISANNNEQIGEMISKAFETIGPLGVISLEEGKTEKSEMEVLGGYHLNQGMISPMFITDQRKRECVLENPLVLVYDKRISKMADIISTLKYVLEFPVTGGTISRPLLIIANSVESEALGTLIANKVKGILEVCVVTAPEVGVRRTEVLHDIAIFTGGKVVSEDYGMGLDKSNFDPSFLGEAQKVVVTKDRCVIVNGQGEPDKVVERQKMIKEMVKDADSDYEREYLRRRAGSIGKGVAILKIGAPTDVERRYLEDLAEDAILAVRAAVEEGYLPGGGVGLFRCSIGLSDKILNNVLKVPMKKLLELSDMSTSFDPANIKDSDSVVEKISQGWGYNALQNGWMDMEKAGVIDAAKVVRKAVENAVSVALMYLATEVLITEVEEGYELGVDGTSGTLAPVSGER